MIFTSIDENGIIVFNEGFKHITVEEQLKEREKAYKDTITLFKTHVHKDSKYFRYFRYGWVSASGKITNVNENISKNFKLYNDKSNLTDFLTGKTDDITIGYVDFRVIGNDGSHSNKDAPTEETMITYGAVINAKPKIIMSKLPKNYKVTCNGMYFEKVDVILKAPKIKGKFVK